MLRCSKKEFGINRKKIFYLEDSSMGNVFNSTNRSRPHHSAKKNAKPKKAYSLAFLVLDLTGSSTSDEIIKVTQTLIAHDGSATTTKHLFRNTEYPISLEAFEYHGLSEFHLKEMHPLTNENFNFTLAENIVVWDGKVTKALFKNNGITKYSPIINLHALARYLEHEPKPIRLNDYALKALSQKKLQVEVLLRNPENKIKVLPEILEFLSKEYQEKFGENRNSFLVIVGKAHNKKNAMSDIATYLKKRDAIQSRISQFKRKIEATEAEKPVKNEGRKVIQVVIKQNTETTKAKKKNHFSQRKKQGK